MNADWVNSVCVEPLARRTGNALGGERQITYRSAKRLAIAGIVMEFAGVLYDDTAWQRWLLQQLAKIGLQTQYGPFFYVFERDYLPAVHCGRNYWDALHDFLVASGLTPGQIDEVTTAGQSRYCQFEENVRPFPGVAAALNKLAQHHVPVAILTNSAYSVDELQRRLQTMGIENRFVAVLSSRDLGCRKPDRTCYEAAVKTLRLPAHVVGYLGMKQCALRGATKAGLTSIAINFEPERKPISWSTASTNCPT